MLVYEYMARGSLDGYLFCVGACLSWRETYNIMVGVARGLTYLHDGCHECIIHCDIKPGNILLDEDLSPRIADFGMAKLVGRDFSCALTTMRGTVGYLAPEWISGHPPAARPTCIALEWCYSSSSRDDEIPRGTARWRLQGVRVVSRGPSSLCGPRGRS
uniref:non-specific serine/threonine protein kinase n=1 Tax=Triticum urartu TaxID=4572 RepID=A0A8R7R751_TRIUA